MKTEEELERIYDNAEEKVPSGTFWRHIKSGNIYHTLMAVLREEDCIPLVVYHGFHTPTLPYKTPYKRPRAWPLDAFLQKFQRITRTEASKELNESREKSDV